MAAEMWFYAFPVIVVLGVILLWFGARGKQLEEEARDDPELPPHR